MKITREKDKTLNSWIWKANFVYRGKRYRPKAFSKADLEEIITQIKSNVNRGDYGLESRAPKITLQQLFDEHIRGFDLTKKTHRRGKVILETFLDRVGGNTPVESIGAPDIRSFILWRKDQSNLKPESINKECGYISALLRHAPEYFRQLQDYTPPRIPWAPAPKNSSQRIIYKDERDRLIAYMRYPDLHPNEKPASRLARLEYLDMFLLTFHGVLRWGETSLLEWRMFDERQARLTLPPEITKIKEGRYVYLNSTAIEILKRRRKAAASKYIFPGNTPDVPRRYYYEGIRRIARKLNLPFGRDTGFTLHSLKHSALTEIVENTGDVAAAQAAGAHSRSTMTLKYTHTTQKRVADAMETLVEKQPDSETK